MPETKKPKTKFELKREASYEALLASAMRAFYENGYTRARLGDLVAGSGYTTGAFYFHFSSKRECLFAVQDYRRRLRGDWVKALEPLIESAPLEQVISSVFGVFDESLHSMHAWTAVLVDFYDQHHEDAEVREQLKEIYQSWIDELGAFIERLIAKGRIEESRGTAALPIQLLAFGEGLDTHARIFAIERDLYRQALVDGVMKLLTG